MNYVIYFIITIGILVLVHEFGHFIAAKLCKMRTDAFAIGFGYRLFGWSKKDGFSFGKLPDDWDGDGCTDYRLCLLPLGGYVKIAGMVDESFDVKFADAEPKPYEFRSKPMMQKLFVISAGVIMNLLLALIIFWSVNFSQPRVIMKTTTVGYSDTTNTNGKLGFNTGDKILTINGSNVSSWDDVVKSLFINNMGKDINVRIIRDGKEQNLLIDKKKVPNQNDTISFFPERTVTQIKDFSAGSPGEKSGLMKEDIIVAVNGKIIFTRENAIKIFESNKSAILPIAVKRANADTIINVKIGDDGKIGAFIGDIYNGPKEYLAYGVGESFVLACKEIYNLTDLTLSMMGRVFTGKVEFKQAFGGPIKIAQFAAKSANNGLLSFIYFLALLSLSLAIINIMPFPVLDGGHLVIIVIEAIIKREIPIKVKMAIQNAGFVLLLLLMAFIIYNDVLSLKLF